MRGVGYYGSEANTETQGQGKRGRGGEGKRGRGGGGWVTGEAGLGE